MIWLAFSSKFFSIVRSEFTERKIHYQYYSDELIECDDLFIIGYYSRRYRYKDVTDLLLEPGDDGAELALGHAVILYKDKIYDSRNATVKPLKDHECMECHTKRIFRFVPADYEKGI